MLPMAGLFLPETLHRRDRTTMEEAEKDISRPHFFQRTSLRPDGEAREARLSTASFSDVRSSSEDVTDFSSSTNAFQFADFVLRSGKASSESRDLAYLIDRVRRDVAEASRLYLSPTVLNFLDAWPDKRSWIDTIRLDIDRALSDIGEYVADTFRVTGEDGESFGLKRKMERISRQHKKITNKQQLLSTCHHSLITAISIMQTAELCGANNGAWQDPIYEAPVIPWVKPDDTEVLRGPYSRRETRMSQKNLSLSSMYLPQTEQENTDTQSVNSVPVELPGSTVEDLARSRESIASIPRRPQNSYRHSSARRAYFRNSINDLREHMTSTSENSSPVAELEHAQLQAPASSTTTRRSFDSSTNTQVQTYQAYHPSLRRSSDFAQSLPTLNEKTIERNDSTMSTTAVVAVPQVAKRYQANSVYIHKSRDRHQSLPSALPHNHTSLTDDLADYMIHLSPHSDQMPSVEWDANSDMASPSISIVSCPAVTQASVPTKEDEAQPAIEEIPGQDPVENDTAFIHSSKPSDDTLAIVPDADSNAQRSSNTQPIEPIEGRQTPKERAPSIRSMSSVIAPSIRSVSSSVSRKPLPATANVTLRPSTVATITPSPSCITTSTIEPPSTIANETPEVSNVSLEIDDDGPELTEASPLTNSPPSDTKASGSAAPSFPTLYDDDVPLRTLQERLHDDDVPLHLLQQRLLHQTYIPEFASPSPMAELAAPVAAPVAELETHEPIEVEMSVNEETISSAARVEANGPEISYPLPVVEKLANILTNAPHVAVINPDTPQPPPIPAKPAELRSRLNSIPSPAAVATRSEISHPASAAEQSVQASTRTSPPQATIAVPDPEMSHSPPIPDKPEEYKSNAIALPIEMDAADTPAVLETNLPASLVAGRASEANKAAPPGATVKSEAAPVSAPTPAKPMSAQAKRRAAHQRRMELAFGSS